MDFVDLKFKQALVPGEVKIYETFNPGAIVGIWALIQDEQKEPKKSTTGQWQLLWRGKFEESKKKYQSKYTSAIKAKTL